MDNKNKLSRRKFLKLGLAGIGGISLLTGSSRKSFSSSPDAEHPPGARLGLVKPEPSIWFEKLENNKLKCTLCPKFCELKVGHRGPCRVRENRDGKGYTLAYGNPALIQEDPIERKPYFHVLPGSRSLSIATAGCNLSCKFCEVWDMALTAPEELYAYEVSPEETIEYASESKVGSLSYSFGEPVVFYEYMKDIAVRAKETGLLNLMHTAGYINREPLEEISGYLDGVNVDLKSIENSFYKEIVGGELQTVLDTLRYLRKKNMHIEITNMVIPTLNDDRKQIKKMCDWIVRNLGPSIPVHFARFYPLYKLSGLPRTPVATLDMARETAMTAGLEYVYVSRVTGHEGENTFCPKCNNKIISRVGFVIDEINIDRGRCEYCKNLIPGRWG